MTAAALAELGKVEEGLVVTVVGKESWFVHGLDPAPHARTGERSGFQQAKRKPDRATPAMKLKLTTEP